MMNCFKFFSIINEISMKMYAFDRIWDYVVFVPKFLNFHPLTLHIKNLLEADHRRSYHMECRIIEKTRLPFLRQ